jgi:hypothetical protein
VQLTVVRCEPDRSGGHTHPKISKLGPVTSECSELILGLTSPKNGGLGLVTSKCSELTQGRTSPKKGELVYCHNSIVWTQVKQVKRGEHVRPKRLAMTL